MIIKRLSTYNEFQCTASDCPANCCKGWKIPLDEEFCRKYLTEKGTFGTVMRMAVQKKNGITSFRSVFGSCPFWRKDHLCRLQKEYGIPYMPQICVQFPRQLSNFGCFCEEALYLACPEAARLFLVRTKRGERFVYEETEGTVSYAENTTNDDRAFLDYLVQAREQLTELLYAGVPFDSMVFLRYGTEAQNACLHGTKLPAPAAYCEADAPRFLMDCADFNQLFFHGFYQSGLRKKSPLLYRLCRRYIKEFEVLSKVNEHAANRKLEAIKDGLYSKLPELDRILIGYYEHYLQTDFLNIYEDYSFVQNLLFGIAKTHMLRLLLALYAQKKESISEDEISLIIAVFERRSYRLKEGLKTFHIAERMVVSK